MRNVASVSSWLFLAGYESSKTSDGKPVTGCWEHPGKDIIVFLEEDDTYSIAKGNFEEHEVIARNIPSDQMMEHLGIARPIFLKPGYKNVWVNN